MHGFCYKSEDLYPCIQKRVKKFILQKLIALHVSSLKLKISKIYLWLFFLSFTNSLVRIMHCIVILKLTLLQSTCLSFIFITPILGKVKDIIELFHCSSDYDFGKSKDQKNYRIRVPIAKIYLCVSFGIWFQKLRLQSNPFPTEAFKQLIQGSCPS